MVTIHQPNFFPWLGYFNKLAMSDTLVVLDHVQALRGRSWLTRNRVLVAGSPRWLSMPVHKSGLGMQPIGDVRVQWDNWLARKNLRVLEANYDKHPHFDDVFDLVTRVYDSRPDYIAELNLSAIEEICRRLDIHLELVRSSDLVTANPQLAELGGNELVVAICEEVGAGDYVSGTGCRDFIDPPAFEARGIAFWFQRFTPAVYPQHGASEFVSHLSVLDALFNVGFEGTRELIEADARERAVLAQVGG